MTRRPRRARMQPMDKTQIDERLARLRARAADVLGEPPDTSDAGGLQQVERAIQVGEAAAFRGTLSSTNVRVGSGWRKVRAKLRSGLMRFEDWGSV